MHRCKVDQIIDGNLTVAEFKRLNKCQTKKREFGSLLIKISFWGTMAGIIVVSILQGLGLISSPEAGGLTLEPLIVVGAIALVLSTVGYLIMHKAYHDLDILQDIREKGLNPTIIKKGKL